MTRIIDLVEQIDLENNSKQVKNINPINVSLVLDVSGSTAQVFEPKKTVLAKEVEVMTNYILSH